MARPPEFSHRDRLVPMDLFPAEPILIDLVYANAAHPENIFGQALYHAGARLSLHADLAGIVIGAARRLHRRHGYILILKDGLRTVDAQQKMMETVIVRDHPAWLEGPARLLSAPGQGAHPRGMAIDVSLCAADGTQIDMGTVFDTMTDQSARSYNEFPDTVLQNRRTLEQAFCAQAQDLGLPLHPLSSEWWDFRMPADVYDDFAPLSDRDLPPALRMVHAAGADGAPGTTERFDKIAKEVLNSL